MPPRVGTAVACVLVLAALARAGEPTTPAPSVAAGRAGKLVTTESGLQYADIVQGKGDTPREGDICIVHYTAWLDDGKEFDSSRPRGKPLGFTLGAHQVIRGWEEGVSTMRIGGTRRLIIPPLLGYGERGLGDIVPPNARVTFEVELLRIKVGTRAPTPSPP